VLAAYSFKAPQLWFSANDANRPDKRPLTRTDAWSEHDRPLADYSFRLAVYSFFDTTD
jgi:hypothetical protein